MTLVAKLELGRNGESEGFSSWALDTFLFRILASGEICSGTQLSSTGKLAKRKKNPGDMRKGRGGSSPRLGRSTMQFPSDEQIPTGANFCRRQVFNSSVTPPFPPSYLLVSKSMCSNKGIGFVFVKDESEMTLKNRLTRHLHSHGGLFYKELGKRHPCLISRAPWKWTS